MKYLPKTIALTLSTFLLFSLGCNSKTQQNSKESHPKKAVQVHVTKKSPRQNGLIWKFQTKGKVTSSPVVYGGVAFFGSWDKKLYAVDALTGEKRWVFKNSEAISVSPVASDGIVVFARKNSLVALDSGTGHKIWAFRTNGEIFSSPAISQGILYFGSRDYFFALDLKTGKELWKYEADVMHTPVIAEEGIYVSDAYELLLLSRQGKLINKFDGYSDGVISTSPLIISDTIFFGENNCELTGYYFALERNTGKWKWNYNLEQELEYFKMSTPFYYKKKSYFTTGNSMLYCVSSVDGQEIWKFATKGKLISSPVIFQGNAYVGGTDKHFYAVNADTGQEQWNFATEGPILSDPIIYNSTILFSSEDGCVYALKIKI